jgi:undecaprenyl pyrophosphate phosphatase UppP
MEDITLKPAMMIGLAQALALIPGTSRSGITMSAARFLGFERAEAARFSFLLGIPAIAGAGVLTLFEMRSSGQAMPPGAVTAAIFTFFSALAAIAFLMAIVNPRPEERRQPRLEGCGLGSGLSLNAGTPRTHHRRGSVQDIPAPPHL